ncbi:Panacea domain-containing protein [Marispirochaeta sp.]|uniref:Panacea domain-containing protein n=1 Tax=Marispirochaeta sp. TaxID=2038653 RepID=UPI0029C65F42|nr:Panacea domain-containing protein [Marispirochaeta sp.]
MLQYKYNKEKAIQLAAIICKHRGGRTDYGSIVKLLYLTDRESISKRGFPVTGDELFSLQHGPVVSHALDAFRHPFSHSHTWLEFFEIEKGNKYVTLKKDPGFDDLSPADIKILKNVLSEYGNWKFSNLRKFTHNAKRFPEYTEIESGRERIDPAEILRQANVSEEDIMKIEAECSAL